MGPNEKRTSAHTWVFRGSRPGLALSGCVFVLYLLGLSHNYTGWSLELSRMVESNDFAELLRPHEFLNLPIGWLFYQGWRIVGWSGGALFPLQVYNAFAGAIAVFVLYKVALLIIERSGIAALVAFGFAVSTGVWLFGVEAEFVTPPLAQTLIVFSWLAEASPTELIRPVRICMLGVGSSVCILTYITSGVLIPVVFVGYLLIGTESLRKRLQCISLYLGIVALLCVTAGSWMMMRFNGVGALQDLGHGHIYGGQGVGLLFGRFELTNLIYGAYGFLKTLAGYPGLGLENRASSYLSGASSGVRLAFSVHCVFSMALASMPLVLGAREWRRLAESKGRFLAALAVWGVTYAGFAVYWVPKDQQFWVPVLIPWWLLCGMLLARSMPEGLGPTRVRAALRRPIATVVVLTVVVALIDGFGTILPNRALTRNVAYRIAESVRRNTSDVDAILTTGGDPLYAYIQYFTDRRTVCLAREVMRAQARSRDDVIRVLDNNIARRQPGDGRIFLVQMGADYDVRWDDLAAVGLRREYLGHLQTRPAWPVEGGEVLEIVR